MKTILTSHEIIAAYAAITYFRMYLKINDKSQRIPIYEQLSQEQYEKLISTALDKQIEEKLYTAVDNSNMLELSESECQWLISALSIIDLTSARTLRDKLWKPYCDTIKNAHRFVTRTKQLYNNINNNAVKRNKTANVKETVASK